MGVLMKRLCDCELGHNGGGMDTRECDCEERKAMTQTTEADPDVVAWRDAFVAANGWQPDVLPQYKAGWFTWRHPHGNWMTGRHRRESLREMTARLLERASWQNWKVALLQAATADGMGGINPDDYRDYYDDGYEPSDAWAEDCSHTY